MTSPASNFLYKFRFFADFAAIGTLCLMFIFTIVVITISRDIIDEIDEVRDVFMLKKQVFEMYANDAEMIMSSDRHLDGFSDLFGELIRVPRQSSNTCN